MNNFTFGQSITQLSRQQLLPCPVSGTARPPARAPFSESHCGGRHRQSLIFNTFASGGSVARRVARDVASWWQVAGESVARCQLAWCSCKWFTFHLLPCRPDDHSECVCMPRVCALCVACMRVVAAGNCMLLVLAAYTIPSTDTETIFYFYFIFTKFALRRFIYQ